MPRDGPRRAARIRRARGDDPLRVGPDRVGSAAVAEALPDATTILASVSQSGFDQGWSLEIDYPAVPLTPDVLSAALIAATEADPSAVGVHLYFFEAGTDNPLPIREAVDELGIPWTRIGSGGGWLAGQIPDIDRE
jgi:hypothetical protein